MNALEHLYAELALLDLRLRRQVMRLRAAHVLTEDQFRGLYISDEQVDALLRPAGEDGVTAAALTRRIEEMSATLCSGSEAEEPRDKPLPLRELQRSCGLGRFEMEMLLLAAAPEIQLRYQTIYAYVQNDVMRRNPSVDLALQILCTHDGQRIRRRSVLRPEAPLMRNGLIHFADDPQERDVPLLARSLRTDTRVVDFLLGRADIDPLLTRVARRIQPKDRIEELFLPDELRAKVTSLLAHLAGGAALVVLEGNRGTGRKRIAEGICARLGMPMLIVNAEAAAAVPDAAHLLRREALLSGAAIVVDGLERLDDDEAAARFGRAVTRAVVSLARPLFIVTSRPWAGDDGAAPDVPQFRLTLPLPSPSVRARLWENAVRMVPGAVVDIDDVAAKFALSGGQIRQAAQHARAVAALRGSPRVETRDLEAGAQSQSSHALRTLAENVELRFQWNDIVLPPKALQQLREVCTSLRYRRVVYEQWGFGKRVAGRGLAVLFSGPSGTGKSMAASIIARELGLEMYRVDLSSVVSKYIGETEKNLSHIFEEAQASNAILFFDEADALFGKRSEVKDAHDRYANIEIAYLLQRIETYEGPVILATNLGRNIDEAFARRMQHTIEFPFPDATLRTRIWRGMVPADAPVADDVDFDFLSGQFELAGGNIRNVILAAAFGAAAEQSAIRMRHLIAATARELEKIGRLPSRTDFREYYKLVREGAAG